MNDIVMPSDLVCYPLRRFLRTEISNPTPMHDEHSFQLHEELLFESHRGFVRCCRACGTFELRFGNVVMQLSADDFSLLHSTVAELDQPRDSDGPTARDHAIIWLGNDGTGFRFTRDEVVELHRLLSGALLLSHLPTSDVSSEDAS